jgi:hypothetical protein
MNIATEVLVRAFGDEPVLLKAQTDHGEIVVFRESLENGIPYPRAYVYEWDAGLFAELRRAFEQHDQGMLNELWSRARFFVGTKTAH